PVPSTVGPTSGSAGRRCATGGNFPALTMSASIGASLYFVGWAAAGPVRLVPTVRVTIRERRRATNLRRVEFIGSSVRSGPRTLRADRSRNEDEALHQAAGRAVHGDRLRHRRAAGSALDGGGDRQDARRVADADVARGAG